MDLSKIVHSLLLLFAITTMLNVAAQEKKTDNSAYFDRGSYRKIQNFDVDQLKQLLIEHPQMCIEFRIVQFENESRRLAVKRRREFKKLLVLNKINEKQYVFSPEIYYLSEEKKEMYTVFKPAIQGVIVSLEGECR